MLVGHMYVFFDKDGDKYCSVYCRKMNGKYKWEASKKQPKPPSPSQKLKLWLKEKKRLDNIQD